MRVPLSWLREHCSPPLETERLAERLAMTGTEVERIEHHGVGELGRFVVGRVLSADPHPDAQRLRVCMVDCGDGQPAQIVCGAPNVAAGQTVAVARPGAVMPDGTRLKRARLRGQESEGMILAEDELAIGTDHEGIIVLDGSLAPGAPLAGVLPISDEVLVLEVTPNRPDCLGIYGVAREVHAATGAPLGPEPWADDPHPALGPAGARTVHDAIRIEVECPDLCPRFTARAFDDVRVGPSPAWLKARLMAAGQRPISNVVDITNYVMLLTGQPLHAFDLDRIAGARLTVRPALAGEEVATLDGQTRAVNPQTVLIADREGPTSIAGIMGGARSEVGPATTRVLIEAANWDGANIHRSSLALGLRSEASTRNEKGLAPEQAMHAQAVASRLLVALCGARPLPGTIDIGGDGPPPAVIRLRPARVRALLGVEVPWQRCAALLEALGFGVEAAGEALHVRVPPWRRVDVTREADLIEEVARLGALEQLPATLPGARAVVDAHRPRHTGLSAAQRLRRSAADALAAQGLHEVVGWSFEGPDVAERLRIAQRPAVRLANPLSAEQSLMRTTLLGSLLDVARRNRARGAEAIRLFEQGAVYLPADDQRPREPWHLAAVLTGPARPASWRDQRPPATDFFAAKGTLGALLDFVRAPWETGRGERPFLHPGRAADVLVGGEVVGWLGELHPEVAAAWGLSERVCAFELDVDLLVGHVRPALYSDLTSFPEVREDLAVVVADSVPAARVLEVVAQAAGPLLAGAEVFDVYRDERRLGEGNVSLALRLRFRAADRTLTDDEVAARRRRITAALAEQLSGRVRDR
ncbi:MAG TPA: phenylalanine--tRNA ligase subunit beta [Solirubrobacteraceae bacterium]|nr:phenylalanine--tRNA ligase subunit beta [Solirubrobacteraceae bacterium]